MDSLPWKDFGHLNANYLKVATCFRSTLFPLILAMGIVSLQGQTSLPELTRQADAFFESGEYQKALSKYEQIIQRRTRDEQVLLRAGQSAYHIGDYDKSVEFIQRALNQDPDIDAEALRYLGMAWHKNLEFDQAVSAYKSFLAVTKQDNPYRDFVLLQIKYCASGLQLNDREKSGYIENLGPMVNSTYDDWAPVYSPTVENRIYFTSTRPTSRISAGEQIPAWPSAIFMTDQIDGQWKDVRPLSGSINGKQWERLECFSRDGNRLYFFRGDSEEFGHILVDTFGSSPSGYRDFDRFPSVMRPELGDHGLYFFDANTFLFSSNRPGGEGGFDLYICTGEEGNWGQPVNLGSRVNTAYDERNPWLAADGRSLYFASNRTESMGGYDIFRAEYDDRDTAWISVTNVGLPINSASDERHFILSEDGYSALVSTDRAGGQGGRDLYAVYFEERRQEQRIVSYPKHFGLVTDSIAEDISHKSMVELDLQDTPSLNIRPLYYEGDDVLTDQNVEQLDGIYEQMIDFPAMSLGIEAHSGFEGPVHLDLYFSVKRVERVAAYLLDKGLDSTRIYARAVGNQYPMKIGHSGQTSNNFNRRIEFYSDHEGQYSLQIKDQRKRPEPTQYTKAYNEYESTLKNVSFRIAIARHSGMYNHSVLKEIPNQSVELDLRADQNRYRYLVGLLNEYEQAKELVDELKRQGIKNPKIVPYFNGLPINRDEMIDKATEYPELNAYLKGE